MSCSYPVSSLARLVRLGARYAHQSSHQFLFNGRRLNSALVTPIVAIPAQMPALAFGRLQLQLAGEALGKSQSVRFKTIQLNDDNDTAMTMGLVR